MPILLISALGLWVEPYESQALFDEKTMLPCGFLDFKETFSPEIFERTCGVFEFFVCAY